MKSFTKHGEQARHQNRDRKASRLQVKAAPYTLKHHLCRQNNPPNKDKRPPQRLGGNTEKKRNTRLHTLLSLSCKRSVDDLPPRREEAFHGSSNSSDPSEKLKQTIHTHTHTHFFPSPPSPPPHPAPGVSQAAAMLSHTRPRSYSFRLIIYNPPRGLRD